MKSTIISMLIVLILLVALPMIFLGDNPVADKFNLDFFKSSGSGGVKLPTTIKSVTTDKAVQMYKWRDEHGIMQFSSQPPPGGDAELIELAPNLSTMQAVKPRQPEAAAAAQVSQPGNPYTPGGMKDLLKQAGSVKEMMDQQQVDQQKALDKIIKGSR